MTCISLCNSYKSPRGSRSLHSTLAWVTLCSRLHDLCQTGNRTLCVSMCPCNHPHRPTLRYPSVKVSARVTVRKMKEAPGTGQQAGLTLSREWQQWARYQWHFRLMMIWRTQRKPEPADGGPWERGRNSETVLGIETTRWT